MTMTGMMMMMMVVVMMRPGNRRGGGRRVVLSHCLGAHMLSIRIVGLGGHLGMGHGDLVVHLGSRGVCGSQRRAPLVRRVGERGQRASLIRRVELRAHVGTTTGLVGGRAEAGAWRVGHLALISRLRVSASPTTLVGIVSASWRVAHMVAHVTVSRLGRFASEVGRLVSGAQRSLRSGAMLKIRKQIRH